MGDRDEFLDWFGTTWRDAEDALHNGDATPRFGTWSQRAPVTLFGERFNAVGAERTREAFVKLAQVFSKSTSSEIELISTEVDGDLAYTAHREVISLSVEGTPRDFVLRVTQAYRREGGEWRVIHRHGDNDPEAAGRA